MKKMTIFAILSLSVLLLFAACDTVAAENPADSTPGYTQITPEEAKELMDNETGYIILDARTQEEYEAGHIEGAVMIPEYDIENQAPEKFLDKDQLILVYCRSGRRSKIASAALAELGYTNVKEFGGILDWPYDVVK